MHHNDSKENNMRIAKRIAEKNAAANETNTQNINTDNQELYEFEQEVDSMLATGSMDQALRVIDAEGVAQILPVLDSEPISNLLKGLEEIGGRANVLVKTPDGVAVLNMVEYSQDEADAADEESDEDEGDESANPEEPADDKLTQEIVDKDL